MVSAIFSYFIFYPESPLQTTGEYCYLWTWGSDSRMSIHWMCGNLRIKCKWITGVWDSM